jgi:hypothetical protein
LGFAVRVRVFVAPPFARVAARFFRVAVVPAPFGFFGAVAAAAPFAFFAVVRFAAAGFAAGLLARSLVLPLPAPRGNFGMVSSLERRPAALAHATAATRGPRGLNASGSAVRISSSASTTAGLNCVPAFARN